MAERESDDARLADDDPTDESTDIVDYTGLAQRWEKMMLREGLL